MNITISYDPTFANDGPFVVSCIRSPGIPDEYLSDEVLEAIHQTIPGSRQQEYYKSLNLLDSSVGEIVQKLEEKGMMENTYIIFMSDNGGDNSICCHCLY